ncbi:MAG TPA: fumarylacetoacetate hydrolase family protein [Puia sp.]|nr:fumarylacetoacetate hydrolase family protein [Puia sp.]
MKLYKLRETVIIDDGNEYFAIDRDWDDLTNRNELFQCLSREKSAALPLSQESAMNLLAGEILPPIGTQEVWAAGVTYMRSRNARMEEAKESGGASFYDKVYEAERPELFFKSLPHRVAGHNQQVFIRRDSDWNVPEPELTLFLNSSKQIQGYTIGNDMSSRSIEGENPLYLPQAKMYERSAALGPCLLVPENPLKSGTTIRMKIIRDDQSVYEDAVEISRIKRTFSELIDFLCREYFFPQGCFLMTGTCLVPPNDFTLRSADRVEISIDGIGTLSNIVEYSWR